MKNKPIWAIVCGAIRKEFELYSILALLSSWKNEGIIDGIVISTWLYELENISGLRNKLDKLGINYVETSELIEEERKYSNFNFSRQITQLNEGMKVVPENVWILKCRTDLSISQLNRMKSWLNQNLEVDSVGLFMPKLNYKILVQQISISHPFGFDDTVFFGYKSDIAKMILFENFERYMGNGLWPDFLFFLSPFLHDYPILKLYVESINFIPWGKYIREQHIVDFFAEKDIFWLPNIMNKFYALYFLIIHCCFSVVEDMEPAKRLSDLFQESEVCKGTWLLCNNNNETYKNIVLGNIVNNDGEQRIFQEISLICSDEKYVYNMSFSKEDFVEAYEWEEKYLKGFSAFKRKQIMKSTPCNVSQEKLIPFIFDINNKKVERTILEAINSADYYNTLLIKLLDVKREDKKIYEDMLLTCARSLNGYVLKEISYMLLSKRISKDKTKEAELVFERYKDYNGLFFPIKSEKLVSIYLYGKYKCLNNDDSFAISSYRRYAEQFRINMEIDKSIAIWDRMITLFSEYYNTLDKNEENACEIADFLKECKKYTN